VSTVVIQVPPLRERKEDIRPLAEHFFQRAAIDLGRLHLTLSPQALEKIDRYTWPGNIRELKNVIERAVLLATGDSVRPHDLHLEFEDSLPAGGDESLMTLQELHQLHIRRVLTAERGNVARTAVRLGVSRASLYNKMKAFGISYERKE